ncbi:PcfJ domain-containing protein [Oscillibacter sp.]|uniref:PcfJ domain-containing protein n=1 Tax=Oscillibacter sp. TaxID=1945593 RepID=UPI002D80FA4E|nr:PcfJ domain-containing protein [Oscillibacter sp.]MBS6353786.1 PcfJ domain-containing protein [Oscillibacter sp.]
MAQRTRRYLIRRVTVVLLTLFVVTLLSFLLMRLSPVDPATAYVKRNSAVVTQEQIDEARVILGLDKPLPVQYFDWVVDALHMDFGISLGTGNPVTEELAKTVPVMADRKKYQASIPVIFWIEEQYGANEAMFFAEKLVQSGIMELDFNQNGYSYYERQVSHDPGWFLNVMASPYRINLRRFIDYILFDLYAQGYASVTKSFFVEYLDYLEMQQKFYGKVKEKYPAHFKTEHDIMALKVNQARLLAKCEDFEQQNESIKDLAYSGSGYCIVVPTKPEELAEEGINLSHCVGQYIDRVAGGECHILFLRRRGAPDRSLVTLQLSGKQICQAQGFNRRPITDQERRFLVQWGREKDIQIAV